MSKAIDFILTGLYINQNQIDIIERILTADELKELQVNNADCRFANHSSPYKISKLSLHAKLDSNNFSEDYLKRLVDKIGLTDTVTKIGPSLSDLIVEFNCGNMPKDISNTVYLLVTLNK